MPNYVLAAFNDTKIRQPFDNNKFTNQYFDRSYQQIDLMLLRMCCIDG